MLMLHIFIFFLHTTNGQTSTGEVTLITSFFDTPVKSHNNVLRSYEIYLTWFEQWARIKNDLIVFCESDSVSAQIMKIRKNFGLENRTTMVVVKDFFSVNKIMYEKLVDISNDVYYRNFIRKKNIRENDPQYVYVMLMKVYFLNKANVDFDIKNNLLAWIDFGFNHKGELYTFEQDFSFTLKCNDSLDKIELYYVSRTVEERPYVEVVRTVRPDCITGGLFICPKKMVDSFWKVMNESIYTLLNVGLMDDEQSLLLLATRLYPEMFTLKRSTWFYSIVEYCNAKHMRINKVTLRKFLEFKPL